VRCIGFFCRSQLMRITPIEQWNKFVIIRCGLFRGEISRRPQKVGEPRNILCVGRLCPSKGQAILVSAADELRRRGLRFNILFLGGGEDQDAIQRQIADLSLSDCITLAGSVGHDRIKEELAKADVFVLPSFAEGIPIALMEAMAAEVPVISTAIAGIPELIEHGKEGILVRASDSSGLADAIESILSGEADTRPMLDRAAEKVRSEYDVETNSRELGEIFMKIPE
jgi:colanic acid/amylovoran biosynthesis glycosyltransferase